MLSGLLPAARLHTGRTRLLFRLVHENSERVAPNMVALKASDLVIIELRKEVKPSFLKQRLPATCECVVPFLCDITINRNARVLFPLTRRKVFD
ncbi:hypothetical protein MnBA_39120 [Marinobacterium sp. BA1]